MRKTLFLLLMLVALPAVAQQSGYDQFRQQMLDKFNQTKEDNQAAYDAFRKKVNEEYADFLRQNWDTFPMHEAEKPAEEPLVEPVEYTGDETADVMSETAVVEEEEEEEDVVEAYKSEFEEEEEEKKEQQEPEKIQALTTPRAQLTIKPVELTIKPIVAVVPPPTPAPEPIAPVKPKENPYKKVSIGYFGSVITVGFPPDDNLQLSTLDENALADAWMQLADSRYDITVSMALNARKANNLCDWAYMTMLQAVTEKKYGKTNEAVLAQAFLMTQSGYRVRLGMSDTKLYMLVASQYDIFNMNYYVLDGIKFYNVSGDKNVKMRITKANYGKEASLSLQLTRLPSFGSEPTPKRTLTSRKGVTAAVSVNKNMIDFFNTYPQACFNGNQTTRWAAYANTPMEQSVKDMLYPPLKRTITGMNERDAVGILLNWVQTAFEYKFDNEVWGGDRAFFAQETLYYPYCDCEDRAILLSRLVRDLVGLDIVLIYYPGHLATAVAFNEDVKGDYVLYNKRKYVVCDPTYINAGVGKTMPGMNNQEAQVIALK